jgi:hypothetical protein
VKPPSLASSRSYAAYHFVGSQISFVGLLLALSFLHLVEPIFGGKGSIILVFGAITLLFRSLVLYGLQRMNRGVDASLLVRPRLVLSLDGVVDGMLLLPCFNALSLFYYPNHQHAGGYSVLIILLLVVLLMTAAFPIAVKAFFPRNLRS